MMKSPQSVPYFHGKITRDRAEDLLMSQGAIEGMFLLRESVNGNYVVSICHCNKISHYNVEHQPDGMYQITTGRRFPGPVELVEHHMKHLDGFLTLARIPLERFPIGASYYILQGVKMSFFEELIRKKAFELGLKESSSVDEAVNGPMRNHLKRLVLRELHETQHWFHHFIRRTEADERLRNAGHTEGQFLVRQKRDEYGFVLSISYQEQPKHYKINCLFEKLNIDGGQYFDSLIEMIDHYHFRQDGLLCKLRFGIECPGFVRTQSDFSQRDVHFEGSHSSMCNIIGMMSSSNHNRDRAAVCSNSSQIHSPVSSSMSSISQNTPLHHHHQHQHHRNSNPPQNHWMIPRSRDTSVDSEIRQSTAALVTVANTVTNSDSGVCASVDGGGDSSIVSMSSAADLINFTEWSTNLPRLLNDSSAVSYSMNDLERTDNLLTNSEPSESGFPPSKPPRLPTDLPQIASPLSIFTNCDSPVPSVPSTGLNEPSIIDQEWIEPDIAFSPTASSRDSRNLQHKARASSMPGKLLPSDLNLLDPLFALETQKVYDALPAPSEMTLNLSRDRLEIRHKLGGGNFGCVFGGYYTTTSQIKIPVAIKKLKDEVHSQIAANEILIEAQTMSQLKHQHIVRLIGVCRTDQLLLILELAPLGPINKYLRRHPNVSLIQLMELSTQIARGMAYLEASKFVHRDLAARNVLLVNETYAKISDFGMSKALNVGHEYYRAASAGRWPLKWYAPECIYYFRFNSKSDVWSYGVTLWEIFSYGDRPYRDLKGTDILSMLDRGQRLRSPASCPQSIYEVMLQCWNIEDVARPTFAELVLMMSRIIVTTHHAVTNSQVIQTPQSPLNTSKTCGGASIVSTAASCISVSAVSGITEVTGLSSHYQANSSGSSVARTCYESGESSQLSSPPISSKPFSDKWPIRIFQK